MRISDWSSDVCSSDLVREGPWRTAVHATAPRSRGARERGFAAPPTAQAPVAAPARLDARSPRADRGRPGGPDAGHVDRQIGRASCRESVCQYVSISVGAVSLKKKKKRRKTL